MARFDISIFDIIKSIERRKEEERVQNLIDTHSNLQTSYPATYSLRNVDFNIETRIAKIEILETQKYRTIERYITRDYVRHPVYSAEKVKSKVIKKTVKLTNAVLEKLENHEDIYISRFARGIIFRLDDEELYPSWFLKYLLDKEYDDFAQKVDKEYQTFRIEQNNKISRLSEQKQALERVIGFMDENIQKNKNVQVRLQEKIKNIENSKNSFIKSIFTLFIYSLWRSKKRKDKLIKKEKEFAEKILDLSQKKEDKDKIRKSIKREIEYIKKQISEKCNKKEDEKKEKKSLLQEQLLKIKPLDVDISNNASFTPLQRIAGIEYKKITGCYVIHNIEKDKYYVGQSKDVLKRLKQHFNGTTPKNVIFAEDYYLSKIENKEALFEVRIIPCETKDELDKKEKSLIEQYDAFINGYNGTNGNN